MFRLSRSHHQANTLLRSSSAIELPTILYNVVLDFSTMYINIKHKITIKGKSLKVRQVT
jgi:hypothetical protein